MHVGGETMYYTLEVICISIYDDMFSIDATDYKAGNSILETRSHPPQKPVTVFIENFWKW